MFNRLTLRSRAAQEIATLRMLGFRPRSILLSFMAESFMLALADALEKEVKRKGATTQRHKRQRMWRKPVAGLLANVGGVSAFVPFHKIF